MAAVVSGRRYQPRRPPPARPRPLTDVQVGALRRLVRAGDRGLSRTSRVDDPNDPRRINLTVAVALETAGLAERGGAGVVATAKGRSQVGSYTFTIAHRKPLSLNDREHHHKRAARVAEWRQAAGWLSRAQVPRHLDRVHVRIRFHPPRATSRSGDRRDSDNLVPTLKAVIDGLVDAGVIPDDTPDHVSWDPPEIGAPTGHGWSTRVEIRELDDGDAGVTDDRSA